MVLPAAYMVKIYLSFLRALRFFDKLLVKFTVMDNIQLLLHDKKCTQPPPFWTIFFPPIKSADALVFHCQNTLLEIGKMSEDIEKSNINLS